MVYISHYNSIYLILFAFCRVTQKNLVVPPLPTMIFFLFLSSPLRWGDCNHPGSRPAQVGWGRRPSSAEASQDLTCRQTQSGAKSFWRLGGDPLRQDRNVTAYDLPRKMAAVVARGFFPPRVKSYDGDTLGRSSL